MSDKKMFAVFSAKQKACAGSSIYRRPDGSEVEVTCVGSKDGCPEAKWDDKINLGEVTTWVRSQYIVKTDRLKVEYYRCK